MPPMRAVVATAAKEISLLPLILMSKGKSTLIAFE
jgi:hypothetical protein